VAVATEAQKRDIYFFCGWPQKNVQVNTALEHAIARTAENTDQWALVINAVNGSPPGLLPLLWQQWQRILDAHGRLKALKVGSIELSGPGEINMLRKEGQRLVGALCSLLGVESDGDVFMPGSGGSAAARNFGLMPRGPGADNWIGK
jgi:hypothetical protein